MGLEANEAMTGSRRDRCELVVDLLRAARNGARKTQIFRAANTNHSRGSEYLEACVEAGLLREEDGLYRLTRSGRDVLDRWVDVEEALPVLGNSAVEAQPSAVSR